MTMNKIDERFECTYSINMKEFTGLLQLPDDEEIVDIQSRITQNSNGISKRVIVTTNRK